MHPLFFLAALISEVIGTMAGFGSSTVFLPLALLFVDFQTALVLVAFLHIFGNLDRIGFFASGLDKNVLIHFGLPSVIATIMGALLVPYIPQTSLKALLGVFLVGFSLYSLWKEHFTLPSGTVSTWLGGGLSGFMAGLIGTGGALRGAFLTGFTLPKKKYIATAAAIAIAVDITRLPLYIREGFLKSEYYSYIPVLFAVALAGSFIGKEIVKKIPQKQFRKFVLIALFLIGVTFIFNQYL